MLKNLLKKLRIGQMLWHMSMKLKKTFFIYNIFWNLNTNIQLLT